MFEGELLKKIGKDKMSSISSKQEEESLVDGQQSPCIFDIPKDLKKKELKRL
jgi:hypothetical protein